MPTNKLLSDGFASKFDLIKMHADGQATVQKPDNPYPQRKVYRQHKCTLSKNGIRIGRPPKASKPASNAPTPKGRKRRHSAMYDGVDESVSPVEDSEEDEFQSLPDSDEPDASTAARKKQPTASYRRRPHVEDVEDDDDGPRPVPRKTSGGLPWDPTRHEAFSVTSTSSASDDDDDDENDVRDDDKMETTEMETEEDDETRLARKRATKRRRGGGLGSRGGRIPVPGIGPRGGIRRVPLNTARKLKQNLPAGVFEQAREALRREGVVRSGRGGKGGRGGFKSRGIGRTVPKSKGRGVVFESGTKETPQKRGWTTRLANLAAARAAGEHVNKRGKVGGDSRKVKRGGKTKGVARKPSASG